MTWRIIYAGLAILLTGCANTEVARNFQSYSAVTMEMASVCLIGMTEHELVSSVAAPSGNLAGYAGPEIWDADPADDRASLSFAWARSHSCLRMYVRQSGLISVYDVTGSFSSGLGGIAALVSGGAAAASSNSVIAGLAFAPIVLRDAANLDPQQANAFQAARAVAHAQCETEALWFERNRFAQALQLSDASLNDSLEGKFDAAIDALTQLRAAIRSGLADLQADDAAMLQRIDLDRAAVSTLEEVEAVRETWRAIDAATRDQVLAIRLRRELEAVNLIWGGHAAALVPTPEKTLRHVLASPVSLVARVISGEPGREVIEPEVAAARFNYSPARQAFTVSKAGEAGRADLVAAHAELDGLAYLEIVEQVHDASRKITSIRSLARSMNAIIDAPAACGPGGAVAA